MEQPVMSLEFTEYVTTLRCRILDSQEVCAWEQVISRRGWQECERNDLKD